MDATKPDEKRTQAVRRVAREQLHIELAMEHRDAQRTVGVVELERALEAAYDLGRRSALS
jgi:hypothetical protein